METNKHKWILLFYLLILISIPLKAFQSIDTVSNYASLKLYSGSFDTVFVNHERYHGLFIKDTCTTEDFGTKINSISGCWRRIHNNFSPRFWAIGGRSNDNLIGPVLKEIDAINCAAIAAFHAGGDTIEIDSMYVIDKPVFLISGNTYLGTNDSCGFKRISPPKTILTDTANVNDNKILVADTSGFRTYQKINIASGKSYDSIAGHAPYTASVSNKLGGGDTTIWLSGLKIQKQMLPGDSVSLFFPMMAPRFLDLDSIQIKRLIFDGNSQNYTLNYDWRTNQTIIIPTTTYSIVENCHFFNIPNENIVAYGSKIKDCSGQNLNGSIIHFSSNAFDKPTEVLYNNFYHTNIIGDSIMVHSEAGFTFSAKVQNLRLAYNQVFDIGEFGVGIFQNDDSFNEITDNLLNSKLETIKFQFAYLHPETNIIYNNKNLANAVDTSNQNCWLNSPSFLSSMPCNGNSSMDNPLNIGDTLEVIIDSILLRKSNENFVKTIVPIFDGAFFNLINVDIESANLSQFHDWIFIDSPSTNKRLVFDNGHRNGLFQSGNWGYEGCSQKGKCSNIKLYFQVKNLPDSTGIVQCPLKGFKVEYDGQVGSWEYPFYCENTPIFFDKDSLGFPILKGAYITSISEKKETINLKIFPNPTRDYIKIENLNFKEEEYVILTTQGVSVQRGRLINNEISIKALPPGTYFIKIFHKTKNISGYISKF